MLFHSYQFLLFFPAALLIYFVIPKKLRTVWLLLASYVFYCRFHPGYAFILLFVTVMSYFAGLELEKAGAGQGEEPGERKGRRRAKRIFLIGIGLLLLILVFFKYTGFLLDNLNRLGSLLLGQRTPLSLPFTLALPVGISYFTFQLISYLTDVYQKRVRAERNFVIFALYVAFFPKIISGPIERAGDFLEQLHACKTRRLWEPLRIRNGAILMLWGYFQKLVIADRLAIFTDTVFSDYQSLGSVELFAAAAAFYIQLYTDFAGCIDMARGMGEIMGFSLAENFRAPFFAKNIREYWSRWHMTLSNWLRDYVYIPLGGNRKGKVRRYGNLMVTFLVSGFWHGAAWNYVFWGVLHGLYQVAGAVSAPLAERVNGLLHTKTESFSYKFLQTLKCWLLVCFAYVFFKTPTMADGLLFLKRMLTKWDPWVLFDGSLYELGISGKYAGLLLAALVLLLLLDWLKYRREISLAEWLDSQCVWFRWGVMLSLLMGVLIFGAYGPSYHAENFIYFQF